LVIVNPETLIAWHRRGFPLFWKWKSRVGRPRLPENIRKLIVRMALENPTWGQARVAAELSVEARHLCFPAHRASQNREKYRENSEVGYAMLAAISRVVKSSRGFSCGHF
jgi:hypothetical protein